MYLDIWWGSLNHFRIVSMKLDTWWGGIPSALNHLDCLGTVFKQQGEPRDDSRLGVRGLVGHMSVYYHLLSYYYI